MPLSIGSGRGGGPVLPHHGLGVPPVHLLDLWVLLLAVQPALHCAWSMCVPQPPLGQQALGHAGLERGQDSGRPGAGLGQFEEQDR